MSNFVMGKGFKAKKSTTLVVVGVLLLAALISVKVFWLDQQRYLVPAQTIPAGANLAQASWRVVPANLGSLGVGYLSGTTTPRGYALQPLPVNNLVARASVVATAPSALSRLVITTKTQLGRSVHAGSRVAIWSAQRLENNQFDVPKRLVALASVARVTKASGVFASTNQQVEVLIDPLQTPAVLAAMASDSPIFLVAAQ
ncbi:MAG: hypothetical protein RL508_652 [Actinomycetota bacterium]|jgi:hypothetical protein